MEDDRSRAIHTAVRQFMHLDHTHRAAIERKVGQMGLHRTGHRMLMHLAHCDKVMSQAELARHFDITPPAVTGLIKKLEAEGYIERATHKEDNRLNDISLTEKGHKILEQTKESFDEVDQAMLDGVSEAELAAFTEFIAKLQHNLDRYNQSI